MFAITGMSRTRRHMLERLAEMNGFYLGYEFDGHQQVFMPRQDDETEGVSTKGAVFWAKYVLDHLGESANLALGPISVPVRERNAIRGIRNLLATAGFKFEDGPDGFGAVDFVVQEPPYYTNKEVLDLLSGIDEAYAEHPVSVMLFIYVENVE